MKRRILIIVVVIVSFVSGVCHAVPVSGLDLAELCSKSDLIVVGQVGAITNLGESDTLVRGTVMRVHQMRAVMTVDLTIKGPSHPPQVLFDFIVPEQPVGYAGVPADTYQIVFLKWDASKWELANPYYPSFPATPGAQPKDSAVHRNLKENLRAKNDAVQEDKDQEMVRSVTTVLATALDSNTVSASERYRLIWILGRISNPASSAALFRASNSPNLSIKICALGELLQRNEVRALPAAVSLLSPRRIPETSSLGCPLQNIESGIAMGVTHPWAVPYLSKLLQSDDVDTRRAAAIALRRIGVSSASPKVRASVAPLLARALQDSDLDVRYYGVIGLADISGARGWRPLKEDFRQDQDKYVSHWRTWAKANVN